MQSTTAHPTAQEFGEVIFHLESSSSLPGTRIYLSHSLSGPASRGQARTQQAAPDANQTAVASLSMRQRSAASRLARTPPTSPVGRTLFINIP